MLSGTLCSIYPDRPGSCRKFECGVLHRFGRGALSFDEALDLTKTARLLADTARKAQPMDSPAEARRTWLAQHRAGDLGPQSRAPGDAAAHLAMLALNLFLDKHFRKPHQRVTVSHAVRRSTP